MSNQNAEANRRLLDMLAGWTDWSMEDRGDLESETLAALYQEVGNLPSSDEDQNPTMETIESFIKEKIIPFVISGATK